MSEEKKKEKKKEYNKKYREKKKVTFKDIPQEEKEKEKEEIKEEIKKEIKEDDTITLEEYVEYLVKKNQGNEKKNFEFSWWKITLFFILIFVPLILPILKASSDLAMKYLKVQPEQSISSISQLLPH